MPKSKEINLLFNNYSTIDNTLQYKKLTAPKVLIDKSMNLPAVSLGG